MGVAARLSEIEHSGWDANLRRRICERRKRGSAGWSETTRGISANAEIPRSIQCSSLPRLRKRCGLHGVAQTREVEVTDLERGHDDGPAWAAVFACAHPHRGTEGFDIIEHEDR